MKTALQQLVLEQPASWGKRIRLGPWSRQNQFQKRKTSDAKSKIVRKSNKPWVNFFILSESGKPLWVEHKGCQRKEWYLKKRQKINKRKTKRMIDKSNNIKNFHRKKTPYNRNKGKNKHHHTGKITGSLKWGLIFLTNKFHKLHNKMKQDGKAKGDINVF